jgi:hypothetical protein
MHRPLHFKTDGDGFECRKLALFDVQCFCRRAKVVDALEKLNSNHSNHAYEPP